MKPVTWSEHTCKMKDIYSSCKWHVEKRSVWYIVSVIVLDAKLLFYFWQLVSDGTEAEKRPELERHTLTKPIYAAKASRPQWGGFSCLQGVSTIWSTFVYLVDQCQQRRVRAASVHRTRLLLLPLLQNSIQPDCLVWIKSWAAPLKENRTCKRSQSHYGEQFIPVFFLWSTKG